MGHGRGTAAGKGILVSEPPLPPIGRRKVSRNAESWARAHYHVRGIPLKGGAGSCDYRSADGGMLVEVKLPEDGLRVSQVRQMTKAHLHGIDSEIAIVDPSTGIMLFFRLVRVDSVQRIAEITNAAIIAHAQIDSRRSWEIERRAIETPDKIVPVEEQRASVDFMARLAEELDYIDLNGNPQGPYRGENPT